MLLLCLFLFHLRFQHAYGLSIFPSTSERSVCYEGYGCFSTEPPFTNSRGYLPQSPEDMNVRLLLYTRYRRPYETTGKLPRTFNSSRDTKLIIHGYRNNVREDWVTDMAFALLQKNTNITYMTTGELPGIFNSSKDTKLIIHGFRNTIKDKWLTDMKVALLKKGDYNVFVLDWEDGASSFRYAQAVANTRIVGAISAKILTNMAKTYDIDPASIHMIGFSLGAHVAGYIGSAIPGIGRITGLDPAELYFEQTSPEVRLDPEDARFVDVIHTDADGLFNPDLDPGFGAIQPIGHVDFYVNGGYDQPGCDSWTSSYGCSHRRAIDVFIESINSECMFTSSPCAELANAPCNASAAENFMGYNAVRSNSGIFSTDTNDQSPFCLS